MKTVSLFVLFTLLLVKSIYPQWQAVNTPLAKNAVPDIKFVASCPDSLIVAVSALNEIFVSSNSGGSWSKVSTLSKDVKCINISHEGIIYVGITGGCISSTDNGNTWNEKLLFTSGFITDLEFISPGRIFMTSLSENDGSGVWESSDNGLTWVKRIPTSNCALLSIAKDSFNSLYIYDNNSDNIYKSTDFGNTWSYLDSFNEVKKIETDVNDNIYVSTSVGLYKSSTGTNWTKILNDLINFHIDKSSNNIYAGNEGYDYYIYRSTNAGINWQYLSLNNYDYHCLTVLNHIMYVATSKGLLKSVDSAAAWSLCFYYTDRAVSVNDMLMTSSGKILIASNEGVFSSDDNFVTWDTTAFNSNFNLLREGKDSTIYACNGRLYHSSDEGLNWSMYAEPYSIRSFCIDDSNYILVNTNESSAIAVYQSTNKGTTWNRIYLLIGYLNSQMVAFGINENSAGDIFFSYYAWDSMMPTLRDLRKRVKGTATWLRIMADTDVYNIYFYDNILYLATNKGIYKSTDNGSSFTQINQGLSSLGVSKIISATSNNLICLTGSGIYRSLNNSYYWVPLNLTGLPHPHINNIYYSEDGHLYAETEGGLAVYTGIIPVELLTFTGEAFLSYNILQWSTATELNNRGFEIQRKTHGNIWTTIAFKEGKGTTTEATNYTFKDDVAGIGVSEVDYRLKQMDFNGTFSYSPEVNINLIPAGYALFQNYPNPFNPNTMIKYSVAQAGLVTLKVYDVLGKEVTCLVNEIKSQGSYEVNFDGSEFSSGVYFYSISILSTQGNSNFTDTKKLMLLK